MKADQLRNNYLQLGVAACKAGHLQQAARLLEAGVHESKRMKLKDLGTAALLYNLAVVYHESGVHDQVENLLLRCLKLCRQNVSNDHPALLLVSRILAHYYYECGNFETAGYYYKQALKRPQLPAVEQVDCLMRLAAIENASARHERVQKICQEIHALQINQFTNPAANPTGSVCLR